MKLVTLLWLCLIVAVSSLYSTLLETVYNDYTEGVREIIANKNQSYYFTRNSKFKITQECYEAAIRNGNLEILNHLLNRKSNYWDEYPRSELINFALVRGRMECAVILLSRGVKPNWHQYKEDILNKRIDRIQKYIEYGTFPYDGQFALAAKQGDIDLIKALAVGDGWAYYREEIWETMQAARKSNADPQVKEQIVEIVKAFGIKNSDNMVFRRDPLDITVILPMPV